MARDRGRLRSDDDTAGGTAAAAGGVSALLGELARAPEVELGSAWEHVLRPGAVVGRFELVREIGRGGFGVVYEARDRELGRSVAFKAVRAGERASLQEERLLREAEAAARLSHPNIVTLYDAGRCEHGPYLVLELLHGQTLAARLSEAGTDAAARRCASRPTWRTRSRTRTARASSTATSTPGNVFLSRRRPGEGARLRALARVRPPAPQRRDAGVHGAGAVARRARGRADRRVRARRDALPDDRRGAAVPRRRRRGSRREREARAGARRIPELPALGALVARMLAKDPVERPRDGAEVARCAAGAPGRARADAQRRRPAGAPTAARPRAVGRGGGVASSPSRSPSSPSTLALRHRDATSTPAAGAGEARVTIAVADFENQTGEPELGRPLRDAHHVARAVAPAVGADPRPDARRPPAARARARGRSRRVARPRGGAERRRARAGARHDPALRRAVRHRAEGARPAHERVPVHAQGGAARERRACRE